MRVKSLEDIVVSDLCAGCGICQAAAGEDYVKMHLDNEGFLRPVVLADCANSWNTIKQICPALTIQHGHAEKDRPWDRLWGPILDLRSGYATDEIIRWDGSSGGAISAIVCYLLESGQADYVLQIGPDSSNPLLNQIYLNQSREDVLRCTGSRYAPAAPLTHIRSLLEKEGKRMAFVGKPCDVAAFRAFLRLHPNLTSKVICTISFFCAGTSSLRATEDVITAMGADKARVVNFRYRGRGWPGQARAVMDDGMCYEISYRDSWGKILGRQLQFRCKICADGIGELADITCGDAWYTKDGHPDFEERSGRSLILCRTRIGQHVVEAAAGASYLATEAFRLQDLAVIQPYQAMRRRLIASRLLAMWFVSAPFPKYRGFNLIANARQASFRDNWKSFKGMVARLKARPQSERRLVFRLQIIMAKVISTVKHFMQIQRPGEGK